MHLVYESKLGSALNVDKDMIPQTMLSAHPASSSGVVDRLLETMSTLPFAGAFLGPNQAEIEQIMAQVNAGQAPTAPA